MQLTGVDSGRRRSGGGLASPAGGMLGHSMKSFSTDSVMAGGWCVCAAVRVCWGGEGWGCRDVVLQVSPEWKVCDEGQLQ